VIIMLLHAMVAMQPSNEQWSSKAFQCTFGISGDGARSRGETMQRINPSSPVDDQVIVGKKKLKFG